MNKETATVVAPLLGGVIIVSLVYLLSVYFNDITNQILIIVVVGFPLALIITVFCAIYVMPALQRRNEYTYWAVSAIGLIIGAAVMSLFSTNAITFVAGTLWALLSAALFRYLTGAASA